MRNIKHAWKNIRLVALFSILFASAVLLLSSTTVKQSAQEPQSDIQINTSQNDFAEYYRQDAVTRALRDKSNVAVRVMVSNDEDREAAAKLGTIIEDYGSFVVVAAKNQNLSISRLETAQLKTTVNLPGKSFEPLQNPPAETVRADGTSINFGSKDYYIVQLGAVTKDEWLDSLRAAGVEILQYVPHQAFFVYGSGEAIQKVAGHSRVRWVGRFMAEDKISTELRAQITTAKSGRENPFEMRGNNTVLFDIAVWARADLGTVRNAVGSYNVRVVDESKLANNYFNILHVEMPVDAIAEVVKLSDVITVNPRYTPKAEDERSSHIISGNYTTTTAISPPGYDPLTQFGVDGTNVTVGMVDDGVSIPGNGGFYLTASNVSNAGGGNVGASGGHGHINASIISGDAPFGNLDPAGYNYGKGVAPKSHIINLAFLNGWSTTDANVCDVAVSTSGVNGVKTFITNNSWGAGAGGAGQPYTSRAASFDGFVRDSSTAGTIDPLVIVFSSGNQGTSGMTDPKAAKNIITTGNSENLRTELSASANNMDDLNSSSSRGPAADGRVKPDIVAPGTVITGSRAGSCGSVSSCFEANHAWSTGTSHAAPQIAGAAALYTQYWKNTHSGANPSVALVKAAILNTGQEMGGANATTTIPNGNEGWGRINMKFMLNTGVPMTVVNETTQFTATGNTTTITGKVGDATKPIRIALVWTDPPGAANANPALVNNLDLTVTVGANTYRGNVFTGGLSTTGGVSDTINNVEQVRLNAGVAAGTTVSIQINATAINGDGILGNGDTTDQHFALVAYNVNSQTKAKFVDFDGDTKTDISIFRPTVGEWWYQQSSDSVVRAFTFGTSTDRITPGDYDGDGKTDIAFWRPSNGTWFVLRSSNLTFFGAPFGAPGDTPAPGDYDGDGITDFAVFRSGEWFINKSTGGISIVPFGAGGDIPAVADYDNDGKSDVAIFRPNGSSGGAEWWASRSTGGSFAVSFGSATDKPVQGDYTGDGKADCAFFRPSTSTWFVLRSEDLSFFAAPFGAAGDIPTPGDYDGDGKNDFAVFRPTSSTWFVNKTTGGTLIQAFGATGDKPVPSAFVP